MANGARKRSDAIFFASLILTLHPAAHAFNSHQPFDIAADLINYVDADQELTADGHVVVVQGTSTLTTDHLVYQRLNRRLIAQGHVTLRDNGSFLTGDSMEYDLQKENGTVANALTYSAPWVIQAHNWDRQQDYYVGRDAYFTSCDLMDPHYHIRSTRVHLVPDRYFWAWNNRGYIDTLPVFYSPFMYKNLGDRKVVIQFQPGHDDVNGNFVKTVTTLRLTDQVYDRVYYDHYSNVGNGGGNEFDYQHPGKIKGSLFGYYINPHGNAQAAGSPTIPQYNYRAYHWQQLTSNTNLQANANFRNNVSFNNQYFPQDTNQAVNDITSSVALTKQTKSLNQQLVVQANESPDSGDTNPYAATHIQTAALPQYNLTLYQTPVWKPHSEQATHLSSSSLPSGTTAAPLVFTPPGNHWGPLLLTGAFSTGEHYARTNQSIQTASSGNLALSSSLPLGRYFSFTPSISPQLNWQDKYTAPPTIPVVSTAPLVGPIPGLGQYRGFQSLLGTAENLRWRPSSSLTFDQTYSLNYRMEPNGLALDRSQVDGGIQTNHWSPLVFIRPSRKVLLRSFSGYDFRKIADESLDAYRQRRVDPWTTQLTLDPTWRTEYYFQYQLGYYPTRATLWEADYRYSGLYKTLLTTGLLYNNGSSGVMTWNNGIGIYFSPSWRVDATVHALMSDFTGAASSSLIDESIIVTRDMHCWTAQFVYRNLPPYSREYSILFNLKLGVTAAEHIANPDLESQFYPWRARTYAM